jgi:hypothetical protein
MNCSKSSWAKYGALTLASVMVLTPVVGAVEFTTSFGDATTAGNWNRLYAQGFKASVNPSVDPGLGSEDPVYLTQFDFFKSGFGLLGPDQSKTIRLAIVNNYFVELTGFTTSSLELVGLSTNSYAGQAELGAIATGDPITFDFDNLELTYGLDDPEQLDLNNYAAIFVTVNEGTGAIAPVLVPTMIVNYPEDPPGQFHPQADYGDITINYFLAASNFTNTLLVADYNTDGKVGAADYTVWRDSVGAEGIANRDPGITGLVGDEDYDAWIANYGNVSDAAYLVTFNPDYGDARFVAYLSDVPIVEGAGASAGLVSVPEPTTMTFACSAVIALLCVRRFGDQKRATI